MRTAFIIPTGIGCEMGGHAGDATPALKLIAAVSDLVITHPNVVNASDIMELPSNAWYVEGNQLDLHLEGEIELLPVTSNKILVAVNPPVRPETINAVNAARVILGAEIEMVELQKPLIMEAKFNEDGTAGGRYENAIDLINQVRKHNFDALAIATPIKFPPEKQIEYFRFDGDVNPWGAIEAKVSKFIARAIMKPCAHAPIETDAPEIKQFNEVVDPRKGAEMVSFAFLHCVLKGLFTAPRIEKFDTDLGDMGIDTFPKYVDVLVSPMCYGAPHKICNQRGISIIYVAENTTKSPIGPALKERDVVVANYEEAAGTIAAIKAGISKESLHRPFNQVKIHRVE